MPKKIQVGSVTRALQRAFGFKGAYTPLLDEIVVPVYVIADPSPAQVTRLCAGTIDLDIATPDLDTITLQLFNPEQSGVTINVTNVVVLSDIKLNVIVNFNTAPLFVAGTFEFRDRRNIGTVRGQLGRSAQLTGPIGEGPVATLQVDGAFSQTAAWQAEGADPRQPLAVLGPGDGLLVQEVLESPPISGDKNLTANFRWIEIPITEQSPEGGIP